MFENIRELLALQNKNILFVGLGNILKNDDGIGVYISTRIKPSGNIRVLTAEVSIENYIGKINSLRPDILVLIDCMYMNSPPGTWKLIPVDATEELTFNTHNISLKKVSEFFRMPVYVLGIQPENIDFGENISYLVLEVADKLVKLINREEAHYGN